MKALVALVFLSTMLAGCVGSPDGGDDSGTATNDDPTVPLFRLPIALPQNAHHGAEPNIAVLDDGTLFIAAMSGAQVWKPGALEGSAWLWRSRDEGLTWERLRGPFPDEAGEAPFPNPGSAVVLGMPFCSCDPDVVTSPDGWVYYTDWWIVGQAAGNYMVERSPDGGDTWMSAPVTVPTRGSGLGPYSVDRQWLVAGDDGFVALFFREDDTAAASMGGSGSTIKAVYSHDHGATWGLPITVLATAGPERHVIAHPSILPDGTILVPVLSYGEPPREGDPVTLAPSTLRVVTSNDRGSSWALTDIRDIPDGFGAAFPHAAAADDTGAILFAYNAITPDGVHLFTVESFDGGHTWSEPENLATTGFNALPWVAGRGDGRFAVTWYHANWTGDETDAPDDTPWYPMAAERAGPDSDWATTRVDETPVWIGRLCFDDPGRPGCGDNDRPLRDYLSIEYGPDGGLHVAYTRGYVEDVLDLNQFYPAYGLVQYARSEAPAQGIAEEAIW